MRGLIYTAPHQLVFADNVRVRDPGPDEVLVRIIATGLCHSDLSVVEGKITWPAPAILGHEGAGVIERTGSAVSTLKPGDRVVLHTIANCGHCPACARDQPTHCRTTLGNRTTPFSWHGEPVANFAATSTFAELTLVKQNQAVKLPPAIAFETGCLLGCGVLTGIGAVLNRAKPAPGATAAVFGVGGVGLNVIQALRYAKAARIIAIDIVPEKEPVARLFGATDFIDARTAPVPEQLRAILPHGVDWAFECAGQAALVETAIASLDWGGSCVLVGVPPPGATAQLPIQYLSYVDRTIMGCRYGSARPEADIAKLAALFETGDIRLDELVTQRYPIANYAAAFADLKAGRLARGVLTF